MSQVELLASEQAFDVQCLTSEPGQTPFDHPGQRPHLFNPELCQSFAAFKGFDRKLLTGRVMKKSVKSDNLWHGYLFTDPHFPVLRPRAGGVRGRVKLWIQFRLNCGPRQCMMCILWSRVGKFCVLKFNLKKMLVESGLFLLAPSSC